jgi:SAM-dependent methyltransferase
MLLQPMDSVRYFEFDFGWRCATAIPRSGRLLDVSSPRCFTLTLLRARPDLSADLANPDSNDAAKTHALVAAAGLQDRCRIHESRIEDLRVAPASYDLVSCISVVEHIPGDAQRAAVERLWAMVRPGGRLLLTVPLAREAFDEYLDFDEYGLLGGLADGWVFGQRFHDASTLDATVFAAIGPPSRFEIVGERCPGYLLEDRARKMAGNGSPWREPYAMATELTRFAAAGDLPGWGIACMEFVKSEAP